ncbi:YciI family protein [Asticcacaulis solisilvae]|uniref:YciI family protein n=1 Tax=Asticcacaulis solisilvae TaxID=1217274 RepID=UPI003FD8B6EC
MPKFLTIGYGDEAGYEKTPASLRDAAHAADADLQRRGAMIAMARTPVQVRNTEAKGVTTAGGPFMTSALPVAGFAVIEAADLDEAIAIAARAPCAVCHGVVEVWPLEL